GKERPDASFRSGFREASEEDRNECAARLGVYRARACPEGGTQNSLSGSIWHTLPGARLSLSAAATGHRWWQPPHTPGRRRNAGPPSRVVFLQLKDTLSMPATLRSGFARFRSRSWSILRQLSSTSSRKRPCRTRLFLEPLEDRLLLSAFILGSVWND